MSNSIKEVNLNKVELQKLGQGGSVHSFHFFTLL